MRRPSFVLVLMRGLKLKKSKGGNALDELRPAGGAVSEDTVLRSGQAMAPELAEMQQQQQQHPVHSSGSLWDLLSGEHSDRGWAAASSRDGEGEAGRQGPDGSEHIAQACSAKDEKDQRSAEEHQDQKRGGLDFSPPACAAPQLRDAVAAYNSR